MTVESTGIKPDSRAEITRLSRKKLNTCLSTILANTFPVQLSKNNFENCITLGSLTLFCYFISPISLFLVKTTRILIINIVHIAIQFINLVKGHLSWPLWPIKVISVSDNHMHCNNWYIMRHFLIVVAITIKISYHNDLAPRSSSLYHPDSFSITVVRYRFFGSPYI